MKTVSIIIGHEPGRPGARNPSTGMTEYGFNEPLAEIMRDMFMMVTDILPVIIYREDGDYTALPGRVNRVGSDVAVSLHANAFNGSVNGCEMLYYHNNGGSKILAGMLQSAVQPVMENNDRGIKPIIRSARGGWLLSNVKAPCVIAEPFFIDNDKDLKHATDNKDRLAAAYCEAIANYLNEVQL